VHLEIDTFAHLNSPLHRWEPRARLIGLAILAFVFSFVQDLRLLPAMVAVAAILYALSRLPPSYLVNRLRYPGFFLLVVAILLPFLSGHTVLFRLGPLAVRQEGLLELILVVAKFAAIMTTALVLFGTAPFLTTIKAMRALGLPPVLADMTLLSYRYLFEIGDDLTTMQTAMGLRGFQGRGLRRRTLGVLAALAGSILVRSYERSERIYHAMVLRGYGRSPRPRDEFCARPQDLLGLGLTVVISAGFVAAELMLRRAGG
jgi:cobalt/nickel transport system permease protein